MRIFALLLSLSVVTAAAALAQAPKPSRMKRKAPQKIEIKAPDRVLPDLPPSTDGAEPPPYWKDLPKGRTPEDIKKIKEIQHEYYLKSISTYFGTRLDVMMRNTVLSNGSRYNPPDSIYRPQLAFKKAFEAADFVPDKRLKFFSDSLRDKSLFMAGWYGTIENMTEFRGSYIFTVKVHPIQYKDHEPYWQFKDTIETYRFDPTPKKGQKAINLVEISTKG